MAALKLKIFYEQYEQTPSIEQLTFLVLFSADPDWVLHIIIYMYAYTYIYTHMHTYIHTCIHICIYIHIYTHAYIYAQTFFCASNTAESFSRQHISCFIFLACGEENIFRKRSLSSVYNGKPEKLVIVGDHSNDHICMSYATFKEKYEMSMTNMVTYAQHFESYSQIRHSKISAVSMTIPKRNQLKGKSAANESTPFVQKSSAKSFIMKGNKLITKLREESGMKKGKPKSNFDKNGLKINIEKYNNTKGYKKKYKKKPNSNGEAKKSKLIKSNGKQENSSAKKNVDLAITPAKQINVISRRDDVCNAGYTDFTPNCMKNGDSDSVVNVTYENVTKFTPKLFKTPVPAVEHLFACSICTDSFVSQNTLDMHLKYDHRPRPTCSQCLKMFDCRRKLIDHEANCSTSDTPVVATATQSLGGIIDFISPVEVFFCVKCENPFPSKDLLRQHKILLNKRKPIALELSEESPCSSHHKNELWEICVKKLPSYSAPLKFDNDYNKCGYCGKSFQNIRRFNQHSVFCSQMKRTLLERECTYCKKSFRNTETCNRHIWYCTKRTHGISLINNNDYSCGICGNVFTRLTDYNLHLRLNHDQRFCSKCNEMYTPDVTHGISHDCVTSNQKMKENTEMSAKDIKHKNDKVISQNPTKQSKRKANSLLRTDCLPHCDPLVLKYKKDFSIIMGENNLLETFGDKLKENIPINMNKTEASDFTNYKTSTPRISPSYKLRESVSNGSKSSLHCIFCPERSFTRRSFLDGHLKIRHNKKQCQFCGDIFRCNVHPYHDCLSHVQSKEVNNNLFEKNIVNNSVTFDVPLINQGNVYKRTVEAVEVNVSDSTQPMEMSNSLTKSPKQTYKCYKCAKTFSQTHFMIKHLANHSKRNPYKCKYCNKMFKIPKCIDDHIRHIHPPRTYIQRKPLVESLTHRHAIKQCHICLNFFLGVADLKSHQKEFHDSFVNGNSNAASMCLTSSTKACHLCHKTNSVFKTVKFKNGSEQICKDCAVALRSDCFTNLEEIMPFEVNKLSGTGGVSYHCEYCFKSFDYKGLLDEHHHICFAKKQAFEETDPIKPLIPTAESCLFEFNFSKDHCNGDVVTFEEAHATLQSLDVDCSPSDEDVSKLKAEFYKSPPTDVENIDTVKKEVPFVTRSCHTSNKNSNWEMESQKTCKNIPGVLKSMDYENTTRNQGENLLNNTEYDGLHILNVYQMYPCIECNVNFDSQRSLDYHKGSHKVSEENKSEIPLKRLKNQNKDKSYGESYQNIPGNSIVTDGKSDKTSDLVPSPNRSPDYELMEGRIVTYLPIESEENAVKEYTCLSNCRSDSSLPHSQPSGNCKVMDSIVKCPLHKTSRDSIPTSKLSIDLVSRKLSRKAGNGIINEKETCKCCDLMFFNAPQFIKSHLPKPKKRLSSCFNPFYPGEYPTALLKKYLPLPQSYITYAPLVKANVGNTYEDLDLFNTPYQSSNHHPPPYAYEGLSLHPGRKLIESRILDPYSVSKLPKRQTSEVEVLGETGITSSTSPPSPISPTTSSSPTCDVNVVVDLLKPLSPESLEKSLQNGSRPKYSKSEVVLKMSRLADTLGRKFGARFKRNAFDFMKDLPKSN